MIERESGTLGWNGVALDKGGEEPILGAMIGDGRRQRSFPIGGNHANALQSCPGR